MRRSAVICLAGLLAACAHIPTGLERPTVEIDRVEVGAVSFTSISGLVHLHINNPNSVGVPLEGGTWELAIAGSRAISGAFDLAETIPARASAPLVASLTIDALDAARVGAALAAGHRGYTIRGTLRFASPLGTIEVQFSHSGDLETAARGLARR